jgi:hypothetical protein
MICISSEIITAVIKERKPGDSKSINVSENSTFLFQPVCNVLHEG